MVSGVATFASVGVDGPLGCGIRLTMKCSTPELMKEVYVLAPITHDAVLQNLTTRWHHIPEYVISGRVLGDTSMEVEVLNHNQGRYLYLNNDTSIGIECVLSIAAWPKCHPKRSAPARLLRVIRAPLVAPGRPPLPGERPVHWVPCSSPPPPKPHLPTVDCAGTAAGKREHIPPVDGLGGGETPWFDITWESRSSWASSGLDIFKSLLSSPPLLSTAPR